MAFLRKVTFDWNQVNEPKSYPFNVPSLTGIKELDLNHNVIFFVGENGSGKSTLLEAIAFKCGFANKGGGNYGTVEKPDDSLLLEAIITMSWLPKVHKGFFVRAETFFDFACFVDDLAQEFGEYKIYRSYGGKSLNAQSHGEAFISLFTNRFGDKGIYILDEPEAALSPQRQLAFLRVIRELEQTGNGQFIIATHSPILMAYPGAVIYSFDGNSIDLVKYEETEHYQLTRAFLNNREKFFIELFDD